ncbi:MAG TPA: phosphoadenylyl-sulfate reductase [Dermatophilaceae bacterium]|nr:phosphoadenylyl-sulfate reductase [Dermatophilaceae bacterium]
MTVVDTRPVPAIRDIRTPRVIEVRYLSQAERGEVLAEVNAALEGASAQEIARWAAHHFGDKLVIASSMQDTVIPHLFGQAAPGVDVVFLDTGYHFPETLATRDEVRRRFPVTVLNITPRQTVAEQDADYGPRLHDNDPDLCCFLRKVEPLAAAMDGRHAWVTGLRRSESPARALTPVVSWDPKNDMVKVCPLVDWTDDDVEAYQVEHDLPRNPLIAAGYPSIGCAPCTRKVAPGADPRSGRWAGKGKVECGIHI